MIPILTCKKKFFLFCFLKSKIFFIQIHLFQEKEEAQVAPKAIKSTKAYVSSKVAVKPAGNNKGIKCNAKPFALGVKRRKKPVQSFGKLINHQNYVKTVN